ncbi:MAG: thermonuclease family protein [Planctomycetia bacterium]
MSHRFPSVIPLTGLFPAVLFLTGSLSAGLFPGCLFPAGLFPVRVAAAADTEHRWRIVNVHDGDTVTALDEANTQHRIRLEGIDAPELGQPFGRVARDRLADLAKGKTATIHGHGQDRYGRLLASVEIEREDMGRQLVAEGLAWHYARFSKDASLAAAERDARAAGKGLWGDREPVPPWEWRASERDRKRQPATR